MQRKICQSIALVSLVFSLGCPEPPPTFPHKSGEAVKVVGANRGHELVLEKNGKKGVLRLVGIYTFAASINEKGDISTLANNSIDWVKKELVGKTVNLILEREKPDPRGRFLGYIEMDGVDYSLKMVQEGQAVLYTEYPFKREAAYMAADTAAREANLGMWKSDTAPKRLRNLRSTWASVRKGKQAPVNDPLLAK